MAKLATELEMLRGFSFGAKPMIDWTISIGNISVLFGISCSMLLYAFRSGKFAESIEAMKEDMKEMKEVSKELAKLLTVVAVQTSEMNNTNERVNILDKRVDDLRRGHGWITGHERRGIDGEYK